MEYKIVFAGVTGAGKTTAIGSVSEIDPVRTDVRNHDASLAKEFTTVGLDYGEVALEGSDRLRLYGTPGQTRFEFMWRIVSQGALGLVLLADNSQDGALDAIDTYIDGFSELIDRTACVIGVGRSESHSEPGLDDYADRLAERGVICPVVPVDVRRRSDVLMLLDLLLTQLEMKTGTTDELF
ncbi:GTP-binding protein [Guyparkeria sp.]|uniref:GTP-binding protein n=1 Tax=Guyparkeria sp. TaxID=2035736 RepID=UPI0035614FB7